MAFDETAKANLEDHQRKAALTEGRLQDIAARAARFETRRKRAAEIVKCIPRGRLFIALRGLSVDAPLEILGERALLRPVLQAPRVVELASAVNHSTSSDYLVAARYLNDVTAEFVLDLDYDDQAMLNIAWYVVIALKLQMLYGAQGVLASPVSFDRIPLIADQSLHLTLLDDYPNILLPPGSQSAATSDIAHWVGENLSTILDFCNPSNSRRFQLALTLFNSSNLGKEARVALTLAWSGMESLFGSSADVQVATKLCNRIATWLALDERLVQDLYRLRGRAVHGRALAEAELLRGYADSADLLRRALCRAVESRAAPLPDA